MSEPITRTSVNAIVDLSCGDYFGIIIPRSTGVIFTNQVGGHSCKHPECEGIFIPLDDGIGRPTRYVLQQHFVGSWATLTEGDAKVVDGALQKGNLGFICVDRTKLAFSVEAWVHIVLDLKAASILSNFDSSYSQGILTWQNSD